MNVLLDFNNTQEDCMTRSSNFNVGYFTLLVGQFGSYSQFGAAHRISWSQQLSIRRFGFPSLPQVRTLYSSTRITQKDTIYSNSVGSVTQIHFLEVNTESILKNSKLLLSIQEIGYLVFISNFIIHSHSVLVNGRAFF